MLQRRQLFKINVLKNFLTEEYSCITLIRTNRLLALPPCFLNDIKGGILFLLNNILKKYDHSLDGILIGFQNVKILMDENTGLVPMGVGETRVNISVEFYIFQPKIGGLLQGVVNKKSNNHIGCLVHCYFNATILKPDNIEYEDWIGKNINVRDAIVFKVKDLDFTGLLPSIEGTIEEVVYCKKFSQELDNESTIDTPKNCYNKKENLKKRKLKFNAQSSASSSIINNEENEDNIFHSTQIQPCKKIKIDFCSPIPPEIHLKSKKTKKDELKKKVKNKHKEKKKKKKLLKEASKIDKSNKKIKKNSLLITSKSSPVSSSKKESLPLEKSSEDTVDTEDSIRENLILKLQTQALESLNCSSSQSINNKETLKIKKSKMYKKNKKNINKNSSGDLYSKLLSDAMSSINYSEDI